MKKKLFLCLAFLLFTGLNINAQSRDEKKDKAYQQLVEKVESGKFYLEATRINLNAGVRSVQSEGYFLEIKGDSAKAYLPFFGRAYRSQIGGDGAIEFDHPFTKLDIKKRPDKHRIIMTMRVTTDVDIYDITLFLFSNNASLTISSNNRSTISYDMDFVEPQKKQHK